MKANGMAWCGGQTSSGKPGELLSHAFNSFVSLSELILQHFELGKRVGQREREREYVREVEKKKKKIQGRQGNTDLQSGHPYPSIHPPSR